MTMVNLGSLAIAFGIFFAGMAVACAILFGIANLGSREIDDAMSIDLKLDEAWRCKRCGMMLASNYDRKAVVCGMAHIGLQPETACPMEKVSV